MLDDLEDKYRKREQRFLIQVDELLENVSQLEHDLNFYGDYIGSEKLFEAKKHATTIYHLVKNVEESLK
jgi:hypothetical protein